MLGEVVPPCAAAQPLQLLRRLLLVLCLGLVILTLAFRWVSIQAVIKDFHSTGETIDVLLGFSRYPHWRGTPSDMPTDPPQGMKKPDRLPIPFRCG